MWLLLPSIWIHSSTYLKCSYCCSKPLNIFFHILFPSIVSAQASCAALLQHSTFSECCWWVVEPGGIQLKNPRHQQPLCGGWMLCLGSSFQLGRLSHSHKYVSNQHINPTHHSRHSGCCSTFITIYWLPISTKDLSLNNFYLRLCTYSRLWSISFLQIFNTICSRNLYYQIGSVCW